MPIRNAQRGTVIVEFLIIIIPLLALILGTLQVALLASAKLVTMQAARNAARAAVVVLNEEPGRYGGEPRLAAPPSSRRHAEIQRAAEVTLMAAASAVHVSDVFAARTALVTPRTGILAPGGPCNPIVAFPGKPGGTFGLDEDVTVRVTIDYPCAIPLGRFFACRGPRRQLAAEATLVNQGAQYEQP
jgi:TadE-like protein